jgi:aromatase
MRAEIRVHVTAPPRAVFDLARDVTRWPELLPHYRQVTVRSRNGDRLIATMKATRPFGRLGVPVSWRSEQWSDDSDTSDLQLRFVHVGGATRGMDVTWHIRPEPGGSVVSIEHFFTRPLPILGYELLPRLIDRLFVRAIAGRTLATFKALAETNELAKAA